MLHAINHCVTTQLLLFDRPSTAVGAGPARDEDEDEEEEADNGGGSGAQKKKKKKKKNSSSSTVADGRHNTLIAGKKICHTEPYRCMILNDTEGNQHTTTVLPARSERQILIPGYIFVSSPR